MIVTRLSVPVCQAGEVIRQDGLQHCSQRSNSGAWPRGRIIHAEGLAGYGELYIEWGGVESCQTARSRL
jgi:hypothetical protein